MIMPLAKANYILFFRINSPINYTYIKQILLTDHPHGMTKGNETVFYVTTWTLRSIFAFRYDGNNWSAFLFANILYTLPNTGSIDVSSCHLHIDHIGRRWIVLFNFCFIIYSQQGILLEKSLSWLFILYLISFMSLFI